MPNVKLRCNMILLETTGKVLLREGAIVDLQKIPARFRKRKYILKEGERDRIEIEREAQMALAEGQRVDDVEDLLEQEPGGEVRKSRRVIT